VLVRAVHVGGGEEGAGGLGRAMGRRDRFDVVGLGVELGHAHAAEADGGDGRTVLAEGACLHRHGPAMPQSTVAVATLRALVARTVHACVVVVVVVVVVVARRGGVALRLGRRRVRDLALRLLI